MCLLKRHKTIIATSRREPSQISAQVSGVWTRATEEMSFQASLLPKLLFIQDAPFKLQLNPSENCEVMMEKRFCHPYYRTKQCESTHRRTQDKGLCVHASCTQNVDEDAEEATKEGGCMSLGCYASPLPSSPKNFLLLINEWKENSPVGWLTFMW